MLRRNMQMLLAQGLTSEEGLSIAPVTALKTFYKGLEKCLDNAISKHVVREQIEEIRGISFLPTDADYACNWNGFKVISSEMNIHASAVNPVTKGYSVSNSQLLEALKNHQPGDGYLKVALFRCLGIQSLRDDLTFYRKLYQGLMDSAENDHVTHIYELLCAFYVAQCTGNGYKRHIDLEIFATDFINFLNQNDLETALKPQDIHACLSKFFLQLEQISIEEKNGVQSLWSIWQKHHISAYTMAKAPIPEIFLRKFPVKKLGHFLITQKEILEKDLSALKQDGEIAWSLIEEWGDDLNIPQSHKTIIRSYLEHLYPPMEMNILLGDVTRIAFFLHSFASLTQTNTQSLLYLSLDHLSDKNIQADAFYTLVDLLAAAMAKHARPLTKDKLLTQFLNSLAQNTTLYRALPQARQLMSVLLETYLAMETKEQPKHLIKVMDTLLPLGLEEAEQVFIALIPLINNERGLNFLNSHSYLNGLQLKKSTQLMQVVKSPALTLDVLESVYKDRNEYELTDLLNFLQQKSEVEIHCLLVLWHEVRQDIKKPVLEVLQHLNTLPLQGLKQLARFCKLQKIETAELLDILSAPDLDVAVAEFQRRTYQENLQRYDYDPEFVTEKIARIKLKSHQSDDDLPLGNEQQELLRQDYQRLMSYMMEKSFKITVHGVMREVTINQLDDTEFPLLFTALQEQISKGINVHQTQLLLIALSAEALYRTTQKFPRCTQILTLLQHIHFPGNVIHELKTGEGKSIVAALHAALLCGSKKTVDIVTENDQLAKNALDKFAPFYDQLGIPHGENIVTAQSAHSEYTTNGINYSTASNLSLFRTRMALAQKSLPKNPALIADEIDAALTSTVHFRLAATLDPLLSDNKTWEKMYQLLLDFVKEKEIYQNNPCSQADDVSNLRNYLIAKNPQQSFHTFTQKISNELLNTLIESAMVAHELEDKVDYYVVNTKEKGTAHCYAAPIIASTKRPDPKVSYSDFVQQLLHTLLNNKKPPPAYPFVIEPSTETIIVSSPKNFFDYYRLNHGSIIGLTGTGGSCVERAEFYQEQGLVVFNYPTYHPDLSQDLGLISTFGNEEHLQKTFEFIKQHKVQNPAQPILLITSSPQATEQFRDLMATQKDWNIQSYHGYEEVGKSEEHVIDTAGKEYVLTLANQSLARGADIDPNNQDGILVINTCKQLTKSDLRQIQGRAARNGKPGQYVSIINAQSIATPSDSEETVAAAFKKHQHDMSVQLHQERAKMRLMEEARYFLTRQILKLREAADKILIPQLGEEASLVDNQQFLRKLSSLNQHAEKHYAELLERHSCVEGVVVQEFLEARVSDYQEVLDAWLPENKFNHIQFIEPSIALETLPELSLPLRNTTVDELRSFADLFHRQWQIDGHQKIQYTFHRVEELIEVFDPFFKKKCSFKQALGQALDEKGLFNKEKIDAYAILIKSNLDEMLDYALSIPVIGLLVPVAPIKSYIAEYIDNTKTQIREKRWDDITLPTINTTSISNWFSGISYALKLGSITSIALGGPLPYIANKIVAPAVIRWIKNALKHQFSSSDSVVAQLLIGLDDLSNDLPEAISTLALLSQEKEINVGLFIDKLGALAKNKALLLALTKYLELLEIPQYTPWVQAIPDVLPLLETYRDSKPQALLTSFPERNCT